jgi:hypothetical protein
VAGRNLVHRDGLLDERANRLDAAHADVGMVGAEVAHGAAGSAPDVEQAADLQRLYEGGHEPHGYRVPVILVHVHGVVCAGGVRVVSRL